MVLFCRAVVISAVGLIHKVRHAVRLENEDLKIEDAFKNYDYDYTGSTLNSTNLAQAQLQPSGLVDSWSVLEDRATNQRYLTVIVQGYTSAHRISEYTTEKLNSILASKTNEPDDWIVQAMLNRHYARKHNYGYALFSFGLTHPGDKAKTWPYDGLETGACMHPTAGPMSSHWCKVPALRIAMERFKDAHTFVWIDTDANIQNMSLTFSDYFKNAHTCDGSAPAHKAAVLSWNNAGEGAHQWGGSCNYACAGVFVVQRSHRLNKVLDTYWGKATTGGSHDMSSFNKVRQQFPSDFTTFADKPFSYGTIGQFLVHRCGACSWMPTRPSVAQSIMEQNGVKIEDLANGLPAGDSAYRFKGVEYPQ